MKIITENYVSLETAKLLKDKGFSQSCTTYYLDREIFHHHYGEVIPKDKQIYAAPSQAMAMQWLREKNIIIMPKPKRFNAEGKCTVWGCDIWFKNSHIELQSDFHSYKEACETAIKSVVLAFVIK
jgi:hypothetical protein